MSTSDQADAVATTDAYDASVIETVTIGNFKSFRSAVLPLAELTLLVGMNASGKSNALEALRLLSWLARGRRLNEVAYDVREGKLDIRGEPREWLREPAAPIVLKARVDAGPLLRVAFLPSNKLDFEISIEIDEHRLRVVDEKLSKVDSDDLALYWVDRPPSGEQVEVQVAYNNFARGRNKPLISCIAEQAIFSQLTTPARFGEKHEKSQQQIPTAASVLRASLENCLFLDPTPRRMRDYSFPSAEPLSPDGANLSGVLANLCRDEESRDAVLRFVRDLPEQDISDLNFVTTPRGEVMVSLEETFGGVSRRHDAVQLSDGTLRVLAIAAAMLSPAAGSLVVIEEIDNGVHPSRAAQLLSRIFETARTRSVRVLLTTHNPALLDAVPFQALPNVVACWRDRTTGESKLTRLHDLPQYSELVAQGPLGTLSTRGILERFLQRPTPNPAEQAEDALRLLRAQPGHE